MFFWTLINIKFSLIPFILKRLEFQSLQNVQKLRNIFSNKGESHAKICKIKNIEYKKVY